MIFLNPHVFNTFDEFVLIVFVLNLVLVVALPLSLGIV